MILLQSVNQKVYTILINLWIFCSKSSLFINLFNLLIWFETKAADISVGLKLNPMYGNINDSSSSGLLLIKFSCFGVSNFS